MKELELRGMSTYFRINTVCQNHKSVEMENLRHDFAVITEIVAIGDGDILRDILKFHEHERHTIHESDNIRTATTTERAAQPQLTHAKKVVVAGIVKIEDAQVNLLFRAVRGRIAHGNPVKKQLVFFAINGI